jgi:hypothetical protein
VVRQCQTKAVRPRAFRIIGGKAVSNLYVQRNVAR